MRLRVDGGYRDIADYVSDNEINMSTLSCFQTTDMFIFWALAMAILVNLLAISHFLQRQVIDEQVERIRKLEGK